MPSGDGREAETTISLRRDFLGASDQKNLSAEGALRAPSITSDGTSFTENIDFTLSNSDRHMLHAAAIVQNGDSASFIMPGAQQIANALGIGNADKRKQEQQQQTQLSIAEQARRISEQLAGQIAQMEKSFEAEMGDAWREQIANKVMEPDDIPQRRDGESMAEYRQRLETVLVATMIDPATGKIRPEYADNPDTARYAQWAQAEYRKRQIENASDSELERILSQSNDLADAKYAEHRVSSSGNDTSAIIQRSQDQFDRVADTSTDSSAFPIPTG
ncbi:MAG: hypothetical protein AAFX04_13230 [Pseudomonadota bacterium]